VWGNVTISVQDVPDAPAAPVRTGTFTGGQLTLSYAAPQANNSPLTRFRLTGTGSAGGSYAKDCGLTTVCTLTDLDPEQTFRFSVVATNGIGDSAPSASSESYSADFVPAAPTGLTVVPNVSRPGALDVRWAAVAKPARGTAVLPVGGYVVEVNGVATQTVTGTSTTLPDLQPKEEYAIAVYAKNRAQVSSEADWARSSTRAKAVGVPGAFSATANASRNQVSLTWTAADGAGGPELTYSVYRQTPGDAGGQGCAAPGERLGTVGGNSLVDQAEDGNYIYRVVAFNGVFCSSATTTAESITPPGKASATVAVEAYGDQGLYKARITGLAASGSVTSYQYQADGASPRPVREGDFIELDRPNGASMSITVQACAGNQRSECGEPTAAVEVTPENTRVDVTSCQVGQKLTLSAAADGRDIDFVDVRFRAPLSVAWGPERSVSFGDSFEVPDGSGFVQVRGHAGDQTDVDWRPAGSLLDIGLQCDPAR
jgi:hypothetical protein